MNRKIHNNSGNANLTDAGTDMESGDEGLSKEIDDEKSLQALKVMKDRGLISDAEYQARLKDFT